MDEVVASEVSQQAEAAKPVCEILLDWLSWPDYSAIGSVITALAAAFAALFAYRGLQTWKDQLIGSRRADLAEELLTDFYRFENILLEIRVGDQHAHSSGDPEENDRMMIVKAKWARQTLNVHQEFFQSLRAKKFRAKAVFGDDIVQPFDSIEDLTNKILFATFSVEWVLTMTEEEAEKYEFGPPSHALRNFEVLGLSFYDPPDDESWSDIEDRTERYRVEGHPANADAREIVKQVENICGPAIWQQ